MCKQSSTLDSYKEYKSYQLTINTTAQGFFFYISSCWVVKGKLPFLGHYPRNIRIDTLLEYLSGILAEIW